MAVLIRAALDSSKDEPRGTTVIAGHIATIEAWEAIEDDWNLQLGLSGVSKFRLSDITAGKSREEWVPIVKPFVDIFSRSSGFRTVSAMLRDKDWDTLDHTPEYKRMCPSREYACLDMNWGSIAHERKYTFGGEPIAIVLDRDWGDSEGIFRVYDNWRARTGEPKFTFVDKDKSWGCVPLQTADLLAGLTRRSPDQAAMLQGRLQAHSGIDEVTSLALSMGDGGHGAMWSLAIAEQIETALARLKLSGALPAPRA